jgi:pimeloyl-ACP methyl ester carboxylesterase
VYKEPIGVDVKARCGHEPTSGMYYEVLGDGRPIVFIHCGGGSGALFRATPDGRLGWADRLAERGFECWVTDWPGCGRSGGRDVLTIRYEDLVDGYARLLALVGTPPTIVCHSMAGAVTWKLVERGLVERVVAVAASYPGNIQPASETISDDGRVARIRFVASGVEFEVARDRLSYYSDAYLFDQGIAGSRRFPMEYLERFRASLLGLPPLTLLQRLGAEGGLPKVERTEAFEGLAVHYFTGTEDPAHTREIEEQTVNLLRQWGAETHLMWLEGNGHFLYLETNSDEILEQVVASALSER